MLKDLTIQKKLRLLALIASLGGLCVTSIALIVYDQYTARDSLQEELTIIGKLIASRSSAAVIFKDHNLGQENLTHLKVNDSIIDACIYLPDGKTFASFHRFSTDSFTCDTGFGAIPIGYSDLGLVVVEPIYYNGEVIARVFLRAQLTKINNRIIKFAATAISIAFISGMLAFLLTSRIQNTISRPLLKLAAVARHVGEEKDYSVRAKNDSNDELGSLVDAFNGMLITIEEQNAFMLQSSTELRELVRKKSEAESRLFSILDNAPDGIVTIDENGLIQSVNNAAENIFNWQEVELLGRELSLIIPNLDSDRNFLLNHGLHKVCEVTGLRKDRSSFPAEITFSYAESEGRSIYTCITRDITIRKETEDEIQVLSQAVEQSPSSVVITDNKGKIEYINHKFEEMTGLNKDEYINQYPNLFVSDLNPGAEIEQVLKQFSAGGEWRGEVKNRRASGELFWESTIISPIRQHNGEIKHLIRISEDITIRKEQEEKLLHQANYDLLTELPNRSLAYDRLHLALAQAKRNNRFVVVMFLDLDRFKNVNDTLGHDAGDQLLVEASQRLKSCIREDCTVARFGGDEFLVILPNVEDPLHSESVAQRIISTFTDPFEIEKQAFFVTASIGVSVYPTDGEDLQALLRNADTAMYRAKELGRSNFQYFTRSMNQKANERLRIETELRKALDRNELQLLYQPIIEPSTQQMVRVEALIRWHNSELGTVSPDIFIPVAEDSELIVQIGTWTIHEACRQLLQWDELGLNELKVSVNVSSRQFKDSSIVDTVAKALSQNRMRPDRLELEITEGVLLEDDVNVKVIIEQLKELGVSLSIDDFGTGYSALSYLQKYPFDILKIDRSFVVDVVENKHDTALCNAIISMAHSLNLKVIGEGVETKQQLEVLGRGYCDMVQGYYYSKPIQSQEVLSFHEMFSYSLEEVK